MSADRTVVTEQEVQEDLLRLEAYRNQLNSLVQQHQILSASRQDHIRARESLEGIDRAPPSAELLLPLGGETFVRGSVDRGAPVLVGVGSGIVVEMERPKVVELVAQRTTRIEQALRDLEGQMTALDDRIQVLSQRLDSIARESGASTDVGSD
ncbi:MAG TPA: prefoldin subunit alpha [Thermoplasmata archaeon]|nr:prefoldin subunit alpha [Thermoplasmata archaeon]HYB77384.1 prefoldin subunit alpha [Thermoplasmata archaeon]